jgi:hypothetical protein
VEKLTIVVSYLKLEELFIVGDDIEGFSI